MIEIDHIRKVFGFGRKNCSFNFTHVCFVNLLYTHGESKYTHLYLKFYFNLRSMLGRQNGVTEVGSQTLWTKITLANS